MEIFKTSLKNLSKNKIHLILIGLAAIIFATVLIYAYVDFSGTKISPVPAEEGKPYCGAIGSRSEGWYIDSGFNRPELIRWDKCKGCVAICKAIGTRSEGWYSSCDGKLIKWDNCGEKEHKKCADTDGGKDYYTKGTATLTQSLNGKIKLLESKTDSCRYCTGLAPVPVTCGAVVEYYCEENQVKSETFVCPNGCANGACVKEKQTCDAKCKSLNYKSGICRMSCETWNNEVDMGHTFDCNPPCPPGMACPAVMYSCCCQEKISEDCAKEGEKVNRNLLLGPTDKQCCEGLIENRVSRSYSVCEKSTSICKDLCGDGICQEIVCLAIGCPCAETPENCPEDCKEGERLSADLNCDGKVNLADMAILLSWWRKDPFEATDINQDGIIEESILSPCKNPDINQDGKINLVDFGIMLSQWTTL